MLLTTLEVLPMGRTAGRRQIAVLAVANVGRGLRGETDYLAASIDDRGERLAGVVCDHARTDGPLLLVARATAALGPWPADQEATRALLVQLTPIVRLDLLDRLVAAAEQHLT